MSYLDANKSNSTEIQPGLEKRVSQLLEQLSLEEKVYMMSGHDFYQRFLNEDKRQFNVRLYQAGAGNDRLEVPYLWFADGPRGVALKGSTCFPVSMARGASWDVNLEQRIGEAMGRELRARGGNILANVCINLLRHPAWGRAQESYGEDPYLLGELGAALTRGTQHHNVIATVKHFAANSIENARFKVDVVMSERVLREVYLPHFKRVIDEGVGSVMSAYNKVNGNYCAHNKVLLRDILKGEWGFKGFVHSDWILGVYGADAAAAGLDIENPEGTHFGAKLVRAVENGEVPVDAINDAVTRILTTLIYFTERENPQSYFENLIACEDHVALAQEASEKSIVLLKNDDRVLPLDKRDIKRLAVIGDLASIENTGDNGSSAVEPPFSVTPLEGLKKHLGSDAEIIFDDGSDLDRVAAVAKEACAVIVFAGYTAEDEGEFIPGEVSSNEGSEPVIESKGGDRTSLNLRSEHESMIMRAAQANSKTIPVIIAGSAVIMENWRHQVSAILMSWYSGMMGGSAVARVLFGDVNPSGKLPFTIPQQPEQLPFFDKDADEIEYGLYHGYTKFDKESLTPAFPFGFGLSYTNYEYSNLNVALDGNTIHSAVRLQNVGARSGEEVVQLYVGFENTTIDRAKKLLRGFQKILLKPGEAATVKFEFTVDELAWFCEETRSWEVENIVYNVYVGGSSDETQLQKSTFSLGD